MGGIRNLLLLSIILQHVICKSVFSCDAVKYRDRVQEALFYYDSDFICIIAQENFTNWGPLEKMHTKEGSSFASIAKSSTNCIPNLGGRRWWTIDPRVANELDCSQKFVIVMGFFLENKPVIVRPLSEVRSMALTKKHSYVFVSPRTGMWFHKIHCTGSALLLVFKGAADRSRFLMEMWPCDDAPDWIISFDTVITIEVYDGFFFDYSSSFPSAFSVKPGDKIAVLTDGANNDLQNFGVIDHRALFQNMNVLDIDISLTNPFLPFSSSKVLIRKQRNEDASSYSAGIHKTSFASNYFEIHYVPPVLTSLEYKRDFDASKIEISIGIKDKGATSEQPDITTTEVREIVTSEATSATTSAEGQTETEIQQSGINQPSNVVESHSSNIHTTNITNPHTNHTIMHHSSTATYSFFDIATLLICSILLAGSMYAFVHLRRKILHSSNSLNPDPTITYTAARSYEKLEETPTEPPPPYTFTVESEPIYD